jgi:hypothetical protein
MSTNLRMRDSPGFKSTLRSHTPDPFYPLRDDMTVRLVISNLKVDSKDREVVLFSRSQM